MNRRSFLSASLATAALAALGVAGLPSSAQANTPAAPSGPAFRRVKLGAFEIVALYEGATRRPLDESFVRNADFLQVQEQLAAQNLPTDEIEIPFTAFLVVTPAGKFLFDTGFADNAAPTTGRLRDSLRAAGHAPDHIDHIVISHYHADHISGIRLKDGTLAFPKAKIHVPAPEHAFWMDDARMNAAPQGLQANFQNARRVFGPLPADRLVQFQPGTEIAPGSRAEPAFGHTPGMCVFTVRSQGQAFMYIGDTATVPALFVRNPEWSIQFDMNPDMARETRRRIFDTIVRERMMVGGYHFPFPAIGTLEVLGKGYEFKPLA